MLNFQGIIFVCKGIFRSLANSRLKFYNFTKNGFIHGYFSKVLIQFLEDLFDRAPFDGCFFNPNI